MSDIHIHVLKDIVDWPLNQQLNTDQLIQDYGISVTETVGDNLIDLTDKLNFNLTNVDVDKEGQYPIQISVLDASGNTAQKVVEINIRPMREQKPEPKSKQGQPSKKQKSAGKLASGVHNKKWILILLVVLVIILMLFGLRSCQKNRQQQAQVESSQSSAIAQNSSSINKLSDQDQVMQNQIDALKDTVNQYQNNPDKEALQNQIDQLKAQNQALKNEANTHVMQARIDGYNDALSNISSNPDESQHYLNRLNNAWYFQPYSDWLNGLEERFNV